MKKIIVCLLAIICVICFSATILVGCSKQNQPDAKTSVNSSSASGDTSSDDEPDNSVETPFSYELSSDEVSIDLYETYVFEIVNNNKPLETDVVWTISDASVATMDNGKVFGLSVGSATVSATVNGLTKTATLRVYNSDTIPYLEINSPESITVGIGDELSFESSVIYKGNAVENQPEFVWVVKSGDAVEIGDNGMVAVKAGIAVLQVSCDYYGVNLIEEISVKVINTDIVFVVADIDPVSGIYYLNMTLVNDGTHTSKFAPEITVYNKSEEVENPAFSWNVSDETVAKITNGEIAALSVGDTIVSATYEGVTLQFFVNVDYPDTSKLFDQADVTSEPLDVDMRFVDDEAEIALPEGLEGEIVWVSGIEDFSTTSDTLNVSADELEFGENKLVYLVKNDDGYKSVAVSVTKATAVLTTKADLNAMSSLALDADMRENYWNGYFVLGDDIDFDGAAITPVAAYRAGDDGKGFVGTFDGRGHIINNISVGYWGWGIFGGLGSGAVIRNVSFTNVSHPGYTSLLSISAADVYVSNIYVQYRAINYPGTQDVTGMLFGTIWGGSISNVVIDLTKANFDFSGKTNTDAFVFNNKLDCFENCYVIGSDSIKLSWQNEEATAGRYADWDAFVAANNDLTSFDESFWDKTDGKLLSNRVEDFLTVYKLTEITDKSQVTNTHDYEKGFEPRQTAGLNKGSISLIHRVYLGCGCHAHEIRYSALNLTKEELIALKAKGKTKVKVAFADETGLSSDVTITANFGTRKSITIPGGHGWDYTSYILEISLDEVIENYDTISAAWYAFFTVTNSQEMNLGISDIIIA